MRTFVEGFVAYAPSDFEPVLVGVTESEHEPLGREVPIDLGGRTVPFLPLLRVTDPNRRRRVPMASAFTWQAWRLRRRLPLEDAVIQLHRPGTELGVLGLAAPKVRFVHLEVTTPGVESRWRRLPRLLNGLEARTLPGWRASISWAAPSTTRTAGATPRWPTVCG